MFAGIGRVVGSQGSFHIKIENLVPTLLISPLLKRRSSRCYTTPSIYREYDRIGSKGDAFLKYRPLKTRENKVLGFSIKHQNCFPNIAVLKSVRSLNPSPPSYLLWHSSSYDFQSYIFFPNSIKIMPLSSVIENKKLNDLVKWWPLI